MFISEIERQERELAFLNRAKEKFGDRFDYSKIHYTNSLSKIIIICREHGCFAQTPSKHLFNKHGCPDCAKISQGLSTRIDKKSFLLQCKYLYGDKYSYKETTTGTKRETITIYCNTHKCYFSQALSSHLKGHIGCKKCLQAKKEHDAHKIFKANFIKLFTKKFGNDYDFSKVTYINNTTPVLMKCNKHDCEFKQVHRNIHRGNTSSCSECKKEYKALKTTSIQ